MVIKIDKFSGMLPKIPAKRLPDNIATVAANVDLSRGRLEPFGEPERVHTLSGSSRKTIYKYRGNWLEWDDVVNVVKSPIAGDQYERIYYTGDGPPKIRGVINGSEQEFRLGVPQPENAPTCKVEDVERIIFDINWKYHYEEKNGDRKDIGDLYGVSTAEEGVKYNIPTPPSRVEASNDATFIPYAEILDSDGNTVGWLYPEQSVYTEVTSVEIRGTHLTARLEEQDDQMFFVIEYDTSHIADYAESRVYVYTYVTAFGEEGPPSEPSEVITVQANQNVRVTGLLSPPTGRNITKKRIYRLVVGASGSEYLFVDEVDAAPTSYLDTKESGDLGAALASVGWDEPPETLKGLQLHPAGFLVGFDGRTLYASEVGLPHAWPISNKIALEYDIVSIQVAGQTIYVMTEDEPFVVNGSLPGSLSPLIIRNHQACLGERGSLRLDMGCVYIGQDGLIRMDGVDYSNLTKDLLTTEQWRAIVDSETLLATFKEMLFVFTGNGTHILDFRSEPNYVTSDEVVSGFYVDNTDNELYLVIGDGIYKWDAGSNKTITWKSKVFTFMRPTKLNAIRVYADSYPVAVSIYDEGESSSSVATIYVESDEVEKLPYYALSKEFQFALTASAAIDSVEIGTSVQAIAGGVS